MLDEKQGNEADWKKIKKRRQFKFWLILLGPFLIPYILFYTFELAYRSVISSKWNRQLEQHQIPGSLEEVIPEIPPETENFGALPTFAAFADYSEYDFHDQTFTYRDNNQAKELRNRVGELRYREIDLWEPAEFSDRSRFDWKVVGDLIKSNQAKTEEIESATPREEVVALVEKELKPFWPGLAAGKDLPISQFPFRKGPSLTEAALHHQFFDFTYLINLLTIKSSLAIDQNDGDHALDCLKISLQLMKLQSSQGIEQGVLTTARNIRYIRYQVEFGIKAEVWSREQLIEISRLLGRLQPIERAKEGIERIFSCYPQILSTRSKQQLIDDISNSTDIDIPFFNREDEVIEAMMIALPWATFDLNLYFILDLYYSYNYLPLVNRDAESFPASFTKTAHNFLLIEELDDLKEDNFSGKALDCQAHIDLLQLAIKIALFRMDNDRLPKVVTELGPDLPVDYFNDRKPLQFTISGSKITIYSFGTNQKDDGGDEKSDCVLVIGSSAE